jgi:hypothetical protein
LIGEDGRKWSMKQDEYYEKVHVKEVKTFNYVVNLIRKGLYLITSCTFEKMAVGDGYRFIVYIRERK